MKTTPKNEEDTKNKDDLKNKDNLENEDDSGLIFFMGEVSLQDGFPTAVVYMNFMNMMTDCPH